MLSMDITSEGVATVLIDRQQKKNALTLEMIEQATDLFRQLAVLGRARAVVLRSAGADFCAGADLGGSGQGGTTGSLSRLKAITGMITALASIDVPVIAAVRGACVGLGWSVALTCDFVIASADAKFQFAFTNVGLAPDGAAVFHLIRHLGLMRAKELIYSGRVIDGAEALAFGLALEITAAETVSARAQAFAAELASAATLSLVMAKRQFNAVTSSTLQQMLILEESMQPLLAQTDDFKEGVAAFRERRKPTFKGR